MRMGVLRTKSIEQSIRDTEEADHKLKKDLSAMDLTVFGIGVIIGTGIFVLTGIAAATKAGPAVSLSFVLAGVACALAALCYAEFASSVPVAGSAYTFSYSSLGELIAWIIGWDLVVGSPSGPRRCRSAGPGTSPRCSPSPSRSRPTARSTSPPGRSSSS
jgi:APA family basic amino acid/polyamine antiporter